MRTNEFARSFPSEKCQNDVIDISHLPLKSAHHLKGKNECAFGVITHVYLLSTVMSTRKS